MNTEGVGLWYGSGLLYRCHGT